MHIDIYHHGSPAKSYELSRSVSFFQHYFTENILNMKFDCKKYFSRKYLLQTDLYTTIHYHVLSRPSSHILRIIKVRRPLNTFYHILIAKTKTVLLTCMLYNYLFYKIGHHVVSHFTNFQGPPTSSFIQIIYLIILKANLCIHVF